jgi:1-acyl-sn-glycerol-3-phosphate acyltransferase
MNISNAILSFFGWKAIHTVEDVPKSIICVAPHTSNYDFVLGKLYYWSINKKAGFLMKKSWFFFPFGYIFSSMGGIPIDRSKSSSVTQQMIDKLNNSENLHLAITPEGTRKPRSEWKRGFYYIAVGAKVPIQLAFMDFKKKEIGITEIFYPTGDEEKDLQHIYNFYKNVNAKKPENFILPT